MSGDPGQYTTELSRVFFLCLERACKGFVDLFASSTSLSDTGSAAGGRPAPRPSVVGATRRESRAGRGGPPGAEAVLPVPLDVLSHLLTWLQNQIAVFASVLARQVCFHVLLLCIDKSLMPRSCFLIDSIGGFGVRRYHVRTIR